MILFANESSRKRYQQVHLIYLLSSRVFISITGLNTPLPLEVFAATLNSYTVYFRNSEIVGNLFSGPVMLYDIHIFGTASFSAYLTSYPVIKPFVCAKSRRGLH